jgi:hypothetical protein
MFSFYFMIPIIFLSFFNFKNLFLFGLFLIFNVIFIRFYFTFDSGSLFDYAFYF